MKEVKILSLIMALVMLSSVTTRLFAQDTKKSAEVTFIVEIDCRSCKAKIESSIPYEKGVRDLKVDMDKKTVWIKYSPDATDEKKLAKALEKIGFPPKIEEKVETR